MDVGIRFRRRSFCTISKRVASFGWHVQILMRPDQIRQIRPTCGARIVPFRRQFATRCRAQLRWTMLGGPTQRFARSLCLCVSVARHREVSRISEGRDESVQCRDTPPQRLDVLPDLLVLLARFLVHLAHARELQVRLQITKRARDVVEMVGKQTAISQLAQR
jgi:hypothetical protein